MKSLLLGSVFSGVNHVLTLEAGPVPQLFYSQHLPSVPNEAFGAFPDPSDEPATSYVILRGGFDEGFKTYGPYVGAGAGEIAANHLFRSQETFQKMGLLPTWTARDDKWLVDLKLPALLADVPAAVTRENMKLLEKGLRRLAAKNNQWAGNLATILQALQEVTSH